MKRDVLIGSVLILFSGLYWLGADQIRESGIDTGVGAQALPKSLAYALAILSVLFIIQSAFNRRKIERKNEALESEPESAYSHLRAFGIFLIGAFYLIILKYVGYILGLFVLMMAVAFYMGKKISIRLTLTFVGGSLAYWFIFEKILKVPMPEGIWRLLSRVIGM